MKQTNEGDSLAWEVLSSEYLFRDTWLTARRERVKLHNGNEVYPYYVLEYPNWVNVIAITREGEFVMVKQYRHGIGKTYFELCAGVTEEEDDSYMVSAQRELLEETGYGKGNWVQYMAVSANPGTHTNLCYCFLATDVEKVDDQHLEATEELSVHLLSYDEIRDLLANDSIKQAMMAAPLWKYVAECKHK